MKDVETAFFQADDKYFEAAYHWLESREDMVESCLLAILEYGTKQQLQDCIQRIQAQLVECATVEQI
jgi:hypothetical protein